ncbi:MAG: autotransporter-associated beta strand repeat-containing protein, partial [Planctomycetota bacterium]
NSSDLWIGNNGTGTLNVNGGSVTNTIGYVGNNPSSVGTATVSSGTWANSGDLLIGNNGTGTLNVSGGKVTNSAGVLGYAAGSVGTATVTGGTWANAGNFLVGYSGTGTLTISGSGLVSVSGTLSKGTSGTINLNSGGTLQIGVGGAGGVLDVAALTNNGTLIFNRSNASNYSGIISGTGSVTKQGSGQLTFNGANSYTGLTTISGGTIALSGTGSIGTGGLNLGSGGVFDIVALASSIYSLPSTGNLTGSGTLSGIGHTLAVLGSFLPGTSPGAVTVDTGLVLDLSGATSTTFDITSPSFTPGTYDLVNGNGSVHFGSVLSLIFSGGTYNNGTDVVQLFANTGGFTGSFSSVNSFGLAAGQYAAFNAGNGFISIVPEPSTYALTAIGVGIVGLMHRRKRATAKIAT